MPDRRIRLLPQFIVASCTVALLASGARAAEVLDQIISREDPAFICADARMQVGLDGMVYLASNVGESSCGMRIDREGNNKLSGALLPSPQTITANAEGLIAVANVHFQRTVNIYDPHFALLAKQNDFRIGDDVGFDAPGDVQPGESGDFYGLDQHRSRILRISPSGKIVAVCTLPADASSKEGVDEFRVCEKLHTFYVHTRYSASWRCVGFDGTAGAQWKFNSTLFQVDPAGNAIYVLRNHQPLLETYSPDGTLQKQTSLAKNDRLPTGEQWFNAMGVFGNELILRRPDARELFQVYDLTSGAFKRAVDIRHERLTVTFDNLVWNAGQTIPFHIDFHGLQPAAHPNWHIWLRQLGTTDYRELALTDDKLTVPADLAGMYALKVTPEVEPHQTLIPSEYGVQAIVEIRRPDARGSVSVATPDNRTHFGRGQAIPLTITARSTDAVHDLPVTLRLLSGSNEIGQVSVKLGADPAAMMIPARVTAALTPGNYRLVPEAAGMYCIAQSIVIGAEMNRSPFSTIEYADYGTLSPTTPSMLAAPDVVAADASRRERLGFNMVVDRLGAGINLTYINWPRQEQEAIAPLITRLEKDPLSPPPAKVRLASPLLQTMAQYSAGGIEEMPILMSNDAGLPLGTGFDNRKPEQLEKAIRDITAALQPTGVMRGWIWSSNWWDFNNAGANAADSPEEKQAYEAAFKQCDKTGQWAPVLETVADRRLSYAVDAQAMFNKVLSQIAPDMPTAVAAPYRNVNAYPPITFGNVNEVDLQIQWEQMAVPYTEPYNVDFYARPGKRAWAHPEVWNDDGTGGQILPNLFLSIMRGSDGVGVSGDLPGWQFPDDPRNCMNYTESIHRQLNAFLQKFGPWLTTLQSEDSIALVADGRMFKIDDWRGNFGLHFSRVFEAYITCLHAHRTPHVVFVEDMTPQTLTSYKAVLLIDQRIEMEPKLAEALANAKAAGVPVFCDGTCRQSLVEGLIPLGISFDHVEKDPSSAGDDDANWRFSDYARADLPALLKTLGHAVPPIADVGNEEVFVSQRQAGAGRYLFVVNHTTPQLDPGKLWRANLSVTTVLPLQVAVGLKADGPAVYEALAIRQVAADNHIVQADLRLAPARIFAVLPAAIEQVSLRGPQSCAAGAAFSWNAAVLDAKAQPIDASIPLRIQLIGSDGRVLCEHFVAADRKGAEGVLTAPLNASKGNLTLQATELLSGRSARLAVAVTAAPASPLIVSEPGSAASPVPAHASTSGQTVATNLAPADLNFGPHIRDITAASNDSLVVMNAFNWDDNLYALDAASGQLRWRKRIGQYFAFSPMDLGANLAVQGFDFDSAEGYHLYLLNADGAAQRRFALYGVPKRLPFRFVPGYFSFEDGKPVNNFAAAADGSWVASAGDLGLAVWDRQGKVLWQQDWWKTDRHVAMLFAANSKTLLAVDGMQVVAYQADSGLELWRTTLAVTGKPQHVCASADGQRVVILASTDGGTVFVLGADGKLLADFPSLQASEVAVTADGHAVATVAESQCRLYSSIGGLQWMFNGDDRLRCPRYSPDGKRLALASDLGSVYVLDRQGAALLNRDQGSRSTPAWMSNGDLLIGSWTGAACRLDGAYHDVWRTHLSPEPSDLSDESPARDMTPTTRIGSWGNAAASLLPISPNLLAETKADIRLVMASNDEWNQSEDAVAHLYDGKAIPPRDPLIGWNLISLFAEQSKFNYLKIDTQHTLLHVTAITLCEDPAHPESWLRDAKLDYWEAATEQWVPIMPLLSNAAVHTHVFPHPVEAARFRIVLTDGLYGNLRLSQIVLHGQALGCSHPDVVARRPVAVLFDEQDELKESMMNGTGLSFDFTSPFSGGRCLRLDADHSAGPMFERGLKHMIPNWDFQIVENPQPGQYRYLQFAWRGLSPQTRGITLAMADLKFAAGEISTHGDWGGKPVSLAPAPPAQWTVMRVDLWKAVGHDTRINRMWLGCIGGPAAFDQILLGRSEKDLADYHLPAATK